MIRGLLHGIKRFWSRRVLTRRPSCHRKRGGFMGRAGIDLFIEDGAYTTLSSAVVILVVLTLLFSSTAAIWSMSRAGDTQVAADSGALAGANVVSSYHTAATVVDASILSLGLAGFATIGTGLVAILIPGAEPVAGNMVDTGIETLKRAQVCQKRIGRLAENRDGSAVSDCRACHAGGVGAGYR